MLVIIEEHEKATHHVLFFIFIGFDHAIRVYMVLFGDVKQVEQPVDCGGDSTRLDSPASQNSERGEPSSIRL